MGITASKSAVETVCEIFGTAQASAYQFTEEGILSFCRLSYVDMRPCANKNLLRYYQYSLDSAFIGSFVVAGEHLW